MQELYSNRWTLRIADSNDQPTDDFKLWCEHLQIRTPEQIGEGYKKLSNMVSHNFKNGRDNFPPSVIEFSALCRPYKYAEQPEEDRDPIDPEKQKANHERFQREMAELGLFKLPKE